jgi:hypothetical protein
VYDPAELTSLIWAQMRSFVGQTAFEDICREWVRQAALAPGNLPFQPTTIGRHWSRDVESDVVALNWETKHILIGECKWDDDTVSREQVRKLIEQTAPRTMANLARQLSNPLVELDQWQAHLACFARRGFTPDARKLMREQAVLAVDLNRIDAELR